DSDRASKRSWRCCVNANAAFWRRTKPRTPSRRRTTTSTSSPRKRGRRTSSPRRFKKRCATSSSPTSNSSGIAPATSAATSPGDVEQLAQLQQQIQEYLRQMAEQQGIEQDPRGYRMSPKAYRLFQSKLLARIFEQLQASRSGRHQGPILGEGATELQATKEYE